MEIHPSIAGPTVGSESGHPQAWAAHRKGRGKGCMCRIRLRCCPCLQGHTPRAQGGSASGTGLGQVGSAGGCGRRLLAGCGLGSWGEQWGCSLPSSERSIPLPWWDKHPLPALNQLQRGWGGTRRWGGGLKKKKEKKSLERKTHFLRQKKKIKSGLIKVNFTGERRERAKHNVLEISSAALSTKTG